MPGRRALLAATVASALLPGIAKAASTARPQERLNELGPENELLSRRDGLWDLSETVWSAPNASPVTTTDLVAHRRMVGSMLQEFLLPASDPSGHDVRRIDYLHFNRVEGHWEYVSMDMRAPVGIMSASSFERGESGRIDLLFSPFAVVGAGSGVSGQLLRMSQTIVHEAPDREVKSQYFIPADGTGAKWLAHQYAYKRRS